MGEDWSEHEVDLIIADYFSMLYEEIAGNPVNKSAHRKKLLPLLNKRSEGSIEFKHCNISAALIKFGQPYIKGYQPRSNYQKSLLDRKIAEYLDIQKAIIVPKFNQFAEQVIASIPKPDFSKWITNAPELTHKIEEPEVRYGKPIKTNYLEKEQRNRSIGQSGEELVINFERWRLINENKPSLADKIEWISRDLGDGAGFDILSKNKNGTDRYIEVKTTKLSKETPIFFTKTEYDFSRKESTNYWLYRVFNIQSKPQLFQRNGHFDQFCIKEAVTYKGYF